MAVQMLYQVDLGGSSLDAVFRSFDLAPFAEAERERPVPEGTASTIDESFEYARRLVEGTLDHREEIDAQIRRQAVNWRLERMSAVDRNILRLAVYELLHEDDVPKVVVLDEAIELAKKYGAEDSGRFVNGLLDGLMKRSLEPSHEP